MKTIVIAGDLIQDFNLVQHPKAPEFHSALPSAMVLKSQLGGAWHLEDRVRLACADYAGNAGLTIQAPRRPAPETLERLTGVSQAYQVWSLHNKGPQSREKVWRISQFLGCQMTEDHTTPEPLGLTDDIPDPDLLLLDDLCLGFREQPPYWPAALQEGGHPAQILFKTSSATFKNPLWRRLFPAHADRLTVVLSATLLRRRGAAISQGLSWDRTLEELVNEFETGVSAQDLGRCRRVVILFGSCGVASFTRCAHWFACEAFPAHQAPSASSEPQALVSGRVQFERLLYDPDHHEGAWRAARPGSTFGALSLLAAALARYSLEPLTYPLFIALGRGLAASRSSHEQGGGTQARFRADAAHQSIQTALHPPEGSEPAGAFSTAYPRYVAQLSHGLPVAPPVPAGRANRSDLLRDLTGEDFEYIVAKGIEIVLHGPEQALRAAPKARYGRYLSVDREEIERINAIYQLILAYKNNLREQSPLSIAVFGPPGSGKSFAVKQLLGTIFENLRAMEFNLSQFRAEADLYEAFHRVRDESIRGQVPLVFWDEFDVEDLRWLKEFLAPMQEGEFRVGSLTHPLGRAIFVFAGGTAASLEEFEGNASGAFAAKKGPDFVSRLRGFINIKGPNPAPVQTDVLYPIRRAILLRIAVQQHYPQLIDRTGTAAISVAVINAFLRVKTFLHGARSLSSLVHMSRLEADSTYFEVFALPAPDLLKLHVTDDFLLHAHRGQLDVQIIELLAEATHEAWRKVKAAAGWTWAETRDDGRQRHPLLVPYQDLQERDKGSNRKTARLTKAKLAEVGYDIVVSGAAAPEKPALSGDEYNRLLMIEHDIWLRDHLLNGYEWAAETAERLRLHRDIGLFSAGSPEDQLLDRAIIEKILQVLAENGYSLKQRS